MPDILRPQTAEELRDLIAWAAAEETPLEILGAGSKRAFGRAVTADRTVHLDRLTGIGLYEPAELVMSAAAGTALAEVEARLVDNHQQLAFEPPDYGALLGGPPGQGTIGGVFACNLAGPRRIKAGAARDHFLGVQAVTGRGDLIKSGGRVVKNVTGYDLCKLLAGSFGTLAAMTEVTFKVLPAPETTSTLVIANQDRAACFRSLRTAIGSSSDVASAACLPAAAARRSSIASLSAEGSDLALIRVEGPEPSVRARVAALRALLGVAGGELSELDTAASGDVWRAIRDVALLPQEAGLWRLSAAPTAAADLLATLERELALEWLADWAGGLLWLAVRDAPDGGAEAIRRVLADSGGGHVTLIRGPEALRAQIAVFHPEAPALARLTARVKDSFDPKRILNRGRMHPDL